MKGLVRASGPIVALAFAVVCSQGPARAEDLKPSAEEFVNACASCHGVDGRGNGYLVQESKGAIDPPDLTQLSKNNGGIFPLPKVFMAIDGRSLIGAHGFRDRVMPVWGDRFALEEREAGLTGRANQRAVRARILELVYFIESIQER